MAQTPPQPAGTPAPVAATLGSERLSQAQLEQLLAPIALHPATLLTQMLMTATYPLEIMQARRWRDRNASLSGATLEEALLGQPWDASVKSLVPFPDVLTLMNDQLEYGRSRWATPCWRSSRTCSTPSWCCAAVRRRTGRCNPGRSKP